MSEEQGEKHDCVFIWQYLERGVEVAVLLDLSGTYITSEESLLNFVSLGFCNYEVDLEMIER